MFVAMNRFRVVPGSAAAFEDVRRGSHAAWRDAAAFRARTAAEQFRSAHRNAGASKPLYLGHPEFEGFASSEEA